MNPDVVPSELIERLAKLPELTQYRIVAMLAELVGVAEKRAARQPVRIPKDAGPAPWRSGR